MNLNKCILSFLNTTKKLIYRKICDVRDVEMCECDYKKDNVPPESGWREYDVNVPLTGDDAHFWFRTKLTTPPLPRMMAAPYIIRSLVI